MAFLPPGLLRAGRPRAVRFGQHGAQHPLESVFIHTLFTLFALSWLLVTAFSLFERVITFGNKMLNNLSTHLKNVKKSDKSG
jgi:hypothetical protein